MAASKSSPARITAAERKARALALRKAGATFDDIALKCGYSSRSGAYNAVMSAITGICREPAQEYVALELDRLDALHVALWPAAIDGDVSAADRVLRIMERRAKLLGLDAPTKAAVDLTTTVTKDDDREARRRQQEQLSRLTTEELRQLERLICKCEGLPCDDDPRSGPAALPAPG